MDALRHQPTVLRTLLFERATMSLIGLLFLGAAVWMAWSRDNGLRPLCEVSLLIGTGVLLGRAGHRINGLAISAGPLGIPEHARQLRRAQWNLVSLYAAVAFICMLPFGLDLRALIVSAAICGGVLAFVSFPAIGVIGFVVAIMADKIADRVEWLLHSPLVAAIVLAATAGLLIHWLRAPARNELLARQSPPGLSDDDHEAAQAEDY